MDADVIVVGAGLAGLRTATRLRDAGLDVLLLEARDRVGGRTETGTVDEHTEIELGGQWLGPGQDRMYELVAELGLSTFPTFNDGEMVVHLDGGSTRMPSHRGAVPKLSPFALADLAQGMWRFERLARKVPLDRPWTAPDAAELDAQTFHTWIQHNLRTKSGRAYFQVVAEAVFSAQAADLSMLHTLFYAHSGNGLENLVEVERGAQQDRVVEGSWAISDRMAQRLGDVVRVGAPVATVRHGVAADGGVAVTTRDGATVTGRRCIVTLPPTLAGRLVYDPPLPSWRDQLTQKLPAGSVIKCNVVYDEPFWRADGLNGQAAGELGPVKVTFDNSPPSGSPGILLAFLEGNDGRRLSRASVDVRRSAVLESLARYFGPKARTPVQYLERDWTAEEFTRGCYGAHFAPGTWTAFGDVLSRPVGPIHWAGSETSPEWNGYMEGAVRSGDRVAAEVLATLD